MVFRFVVVGHWCCQFEGVVVLSLLASSLRRLRHSIHLWPSMLQYLQFPSNLRLTSLVAVFSVVLLLRAGWAFCYLGW